VPGLETGYLWNLIQMMWWSKVPTITVFMGLAWYHIEIGKEFHLKGLLARVYR